jgi:rare lipoprotein A (peptidoglycan hydrolase)
MRPGLAQWEIALAALALLGGVLAFAFTSRSGHNGSSVRPEGDFVALAGSSGPAAFGRRSACGGVIRAETLGVAHPTLPCGVRIFLTLHGVHVLTQVIDRGPSIPGRQFDVTDALARRLGLSGVQQVHWAYARAG